MEIEVRLYTGTFNSQLMSFDEGIKIIDVLENLGIEKEELEFILVNGNYKETDEKLKGGDILAIFPPLAGG